MLTDYIDRKQLPWEVKKKIHSCRKEIEYFKQKRKEAFSTIDFEKEIILTQQERIAEFRNKKPVNYRSIKRYEESIKSHLQLLDNYLQEWRLGKHLISSLRITIAGLLYPTKRQLESIKEKKKGWYISAAESLLIRRAQEEYKRRLAETELQLQFEDQYLDQLEDPEQEEQDWRN